jgi:hypothetical protein
MQALYDYHLSKTITPNVVNMLNIKYTLQAAEDGRLSAGLNPNAYGNAWLVQEVISCRSADEEIQRLATENITTMALTTESIPQREFVLDSLSSISLVDHKANELRYKATVSSIAFAVFSEMHYPHGWQAYIDEVEVPHYRVNYALRGLIIPSGQHDVVFRFEPDVIAWGTRIQLAGYGIFALVIFFSFAPIGLKRSKP